MYDDPIRFASVLTTKEDKKEARAFILGVLKRIVVISLICFFMFLILNKIFFIPVFWSYLLVTACVLFALMVVFDSLPNEKPNKFCSNCETINIKDDKFCLNCGEKL